jgi:asparagine synthetase A
MKELARMASDLISLRQQTLARFAAFNRSAGSVLSSHKDALWAYEARLDYLRGVVVRDWDIEDWK